jgi:hypothetical protein
MEAYRFSCWRFRMSCFIRECPDETVIVLSATGRVLSIHLRVEDAIDACDEAQSDSVALPERTASPDIKAA